jgi:hypothetical protein
MLNKVVCDLNIFRSIKNIRYRVYDSSSEHSCAQGKFARACGIDLNNLEWYKNLRENELNSGINNMMKVCSLNNDGYFEEANNLVLQLALETGKVEFINGLPEQVIKELEVAK